VTYEKGIFVQDLALLRLCGRVAFDSGAWNGAPHGPIVSVSRDEIIEYALKRGWVVSSGKTPHRTLQVAIWSDTPRRCRRRFGRVSAKRTPSSLLQATEAPTKLVTKASRASETPQPARTPLVSQIAPELASAFAG